MQENRLAEDLNHILDHTRDLWDELRGERIFITGGTGFFGCWLLESFTWANDYLNLGAEAVVLTRNPDAFRKKAPHLALHPSVRLIEGDVRTFPFPEGTFSHVVHAAAESSANLGENQALELLDVLISGAKHTLEFASSSHTKAFLAISSGAIYGHQPPQITHISESDQFIYPQVNLSSHRSAYRTGKQVVELLSILYAQKYGVQAKIARCFAFVGPYLLLNQNFAIGNFIRNGLNGDPIRLTGDGTPFRSYLYAADLVIWLWTILVRGINCQPYNVGSEDAITIEQLARKVSSSFLPSPEVTISKLPTPGQPRESYVPSTRLARETLGLCQHYPVEKSISRTIDWYKTKHFRNLDPITLL
jgi:dTDP-glucose 4,6-dehydratase